MSVSGLFKIVQTISFLQRGQAIFPGYSVFVTYVQDDSVWAERERAAMATKEESCADSPKKSPSKYDTGMPMHVGAIRLHIEISQQVILENKLK